MAKKLTLSAGALFLLLGTIAPAYAQHEHEQGSKAGPRSNNISKRDPRNNRIRKGPHRHHIRPPDPRHDRSKAMAAPITAVSRPTAPPMAASTIAASHSIRVRSATVSFNPGPGRGMTNIAPGVSAAAITATGFPKTASGSTSGVSTFSTSANFRWSSSAGIRASSTTAIGSRSLTPGRKTGLRPGMTLTMSISTTPTMGTTCMTARTPARGSQSRSRSDSTDIASRFSLRGFFFAYFAVKSFLDRKVCKGSAI